MELSVQLYLGLLVLVASGRLMELRHSRRNQQRLEAAGATKATEPGYIWMVALHSGVLGGCAFEVFYLHRPWIPPIGFAALAIFLAANAARWWVIGTLGRSWNVQVMSPALGVITGGPYRWVRHPNYTAVFAEMAALPLIHSAWITAVFGTLLHLLVLRNRVTLEEAVMRQNPDWLAAFQSRPRFLP